MASIVIDIDSKIAPFEQIKASIVGLIAAGDLASDHRLPTIRQLAGDLDVAPNTVARAYRELEAAGFVRSRGRRGTVVIGLPATPPADASVDQIVRSVESARARGLSGNDILAAVVAALS